MRAPDRLSYHRRIMTSASETEIAAHVVAWLTAQHWDVYQEVRASWRGEIADIVAVRGSLVWIIECKRSCSLRVISQAHRWKSLLRSIAIPRSAGDRPRRDPHRRFAFEVCRRFEIGVLEIGGGGRVYETLRAPILRAHHKNSRWIRSRLRPEQRTFLPAGSKSGARWTPYRQTMDAVRRIIKEYPGCTLKDIMQRLNEHHYGQERTAKTSIHSALTDWEDWCVVDFANLPHRYYVEGDQPPGLEKMLYRFVDDEHEHPDLTTITPDQCGEDQSNDAPFDR